LAKAKALLCSGVDASFQDESGRTPLFMAAESNDLSMCELLLGFDADPLRLNHQGRTALMASCDRGAEPCALLLAPLGSALQLDQRGSSALMMAARFGSARICQVLLPLSNLLQANQDGITAIDYAKFYKHSHLSAMFLSWSEARALGLSCPLLALSSGSARL
jgi:ankyrin repeat protein